MSCERKWKPLRKLEYGQYFWLQLYSITAPTRITTPTASQHLADIVLPTLTKHSGYYNLSTASQPTHNQCSITHGITADTLQHSKHTTSLHLSRKTALQQKNRNTADTQQHSIRAESQELSNKPDTQQHTRHTARHPILSNWTCIKASTNAHTPSQLINSMSAETHYHSRQTAPQQTRKKVADTLHHGRNSKGLTAGKQ